GGQARTGSSRLCPRCPGAAAAKMPCRRIAAPVLRSRGHSQSTVAPGRSFAPRLPNRNASPYANNLCRGFASGQKISGRSPAFPQSFDISLDHHAFPPSLFSFSTFLGGVGSGFPLRVRTETSMARDVPQNYRELVIRQQTVVRNGAQRPGRDLWLVTRARNTPKSKRQ